jgi:hypothetical protein
MLHIVKEVQTHRIRGWKTLAQFSAFMMLGMSVGIMGPSILDLRQQVETTLTRIALIMTARAAGHVCGSLASKLIDLIHKLSQLKTILSFSGHHLLADQLSVYDIIHDVHCSNHDGGYPIHPQYLGPVVHIRDQWCSPGIL